MAIPIGAKSPAYVMDPSDVVDFLYDVSREMASTLNGQSEFIDNNWSLVMSPEGAAVGLQICTEAARLPRLELSSTGFYFWLQVDPELQSDPSYAGAGLVLPITVRWRTTNVPPRQFERTIDFTVRQR